MIGDDLALIIDGQEKDENFDLSTRNLQKVMYYPQLVEIDGNELYIGSKCLWYFEEEIFDFE